MIERFAAQEVPDEKTSFQRDTYTFNSRYAVGAACRVQDLPRPDAERVRTRGPNGRETDLQGELDELFNEQNASPSKTPPPLPPRSCASRLHGASARTAVTNILTDSTTPREDTKSARCN